MADVGLTATPVGIGAALNTPWGRLIVAVIWLGGLITPGVSLWIARETGRGPAAFAIRAHVEWESRRKRWLEEKLRGREVDALDS
jgi:hypothetical protein